MTICPQVNATLRAVQEEKDNLDNKLKIENDARRELEGKTIVRVSLPTLPCGKVSAFSAGDWALLPAIFG